MSTDFVISEEEKRELARRDDLSDIMAAIDVTCFRLDFYEFGQWWDYRRGRRKLTHPAVVKWMAHYGFDSFNDLPTGAIIRLRSSLQEYLSAAENPPTLKFIEGGQANA